MRTLWPGRPSILRMMGGRLVAVLLALSTVSGCTARPSTVDTGSVAFEPIVVEPATVIDIAWTQLNVALDERILLVLDLADGRAETAATRTLASELAAEYGDELARLREALVRIDAPSDNPHSGHDMPGMATSATLDKLRASRGTAFEQLLHQCLVDHIEQSARLASTFEPIGSAPLVTGLARTMQDSRRSQHERVDRLPVQDRRSGDATSAVSKRSS